MRQKSDLETNTLSEALHCAWSFLVSLFPAHLAFVTLLLAVAAPSVVMVRQGGCHASCRSRYPVCKLSWSVGLFSTEWGYLGISRALGQGCPWPELFGRGGKVLAVYVLSEGGMLWDKEEPLLLRARARIIFCWGPHGLFVFPTVVQAAFSWCNGLLPTGCLMAPAVAGHPEQQFLLFPGEGRGMHTHTNTHTQLIKQQNVHIFLSLYFFFSHVYLQLL